MATESLAVQALVVFEDRADTWWLRLLKPGFRHCFCVLRHGSAWVVVDPLLRRLHVETLDLPAEFGLGEALAAVPGRTVLTGSAILEATSGSAWPRPLTCVEIVKRAIGIDAATILTPAGLHRRLLNQGWNSILCA